MSKTRKINKKKLKEISAIFILIIIVIVLLVSIRKTLSRYQTDSTSEVDDLKVAFYITGNDYQSKNVIVDEIYPSDTVKTFDFSINNFEQQEETQVINETSTNVIVDRPSEVNTEFDIEIKATTYMPIIYKLYYGETELGTASVVSENGVFIQKLTVTSEMFSEILTMEHGSSITRTFTVKMHFPVETSMADNGNVIQNSVMSDELSDLVDNVNISVTSRQKII